MKSFKNFAMTIALVVLTLTLTVKAFAAYDIVEPPAGITETRVRELARDEINKSRPQGVQQGTQVPAPPPVAKNWYEDRSLWTGVFFLVLIGLLIWGLLKRFGKTSVHHGIDHPIAPSVSDDHIRDIVDGRLKDVKSLTETDIRRIAGEVVQKHSSGQKPTGGMTADEVRAIAQEVMGKAAIGMTPEDRDALMRYVDEHLSSRIPALVAEHCGNLRSGIIGDVNGTVQKFMDDHLPELVAQEVVNYFRKRHEQGGFRPEPGRSGSVAVPPVAPQLPEAQVWHDRRTEVGPRFADLAPQQQDEVAEIILRAQGDPNPGRDNTFNLSKYIAAQEQEKPTREVLMGFPGGDVAYERLLELARANGEAQRRDNDDPTITRRVQK